MQWGIRKFGRAKQGTLRTDSPNPAMSLVPARVAVGVVLMTNDGIIPVHDVNGSVRPAVNVDWAEVAMGRTDQGFLPLQPESSPVIGQGKDLYPVGLEVSGCEPSLQIFGQMSTIQVAYSTIPARVADPRELQAVLGGNLAGRKTGNPPAPSTTNICPHSSKAIPQGLAGPIQLSRRGSKPRVLGRNL